MPTGDFPPPEGMRWSDANGWVRLDEGTPMTALSDADQDAGLRDRLEGMRIARDSFKDLAAENAIAADRYARENATLRARATTAEDKLRDREAEIAALRATQNDGAAAMRESIARWHDKVANDRALRLCARDGHREIYDLLFAERVIHRDCARAVRSMPLPPALASQEPGTGGERDA